MTFDAETRIKEHLNDAYMLITLMESDNTYKTRIKRGYELMCVLNDIHEIVQSDGLHCDKE